MVGKRLSCKNRCIVDHGISCNAGRSGTPGVGEWRVEKGGGCRGTGRTRSFPRVKTREDVGDGDQTGRQRQTAFVESAAAAAAAATAFLLSKPSNVLFVLICNPSLARSILVRNARFPN